jgi:hypothetical protein
MPRNNSNRKTRPSEIFEAAKSTLENSSVSAISNIVRNKFKLVKLIWSLCFVASACVCAWFIVDTLTKYYQWEVVSRIIVKKESKLPFPIVYICANARDLNLSRLVIRAYFDLKPINNSEKEFSIVKLGPTCVRFNSRENLKYVQEQPVLANLDLDLLVGSISQIDAPLNNGFFIDIIDENQSFGDLVEHIYIPPGTFSKIYVHKKVIKKEPYPYSSCVDGLTSKVFI